MGNRRCYQEIGPLTHPRGFFSEVILPPQGRDIKNPFYGSWSDSCLGPGLRRVLHQLWDHRSPADGYNCGGQHSYFRDILSTVSGLDYEFDKLDNFLSTRKLINTTVSEGRTSRISFNNISHLDFTAKSLLELIICLKHELSVQVKVNNGNNFSSVYETNKLVRDLEKELHDLMKKLDKFKTDTGICCKRCSEEMTNITKPKPDRLNCPWKNNVGNTSGPDRCGETVSLGYLPDNEHLVSLNGSCRGRTKGIKHRNKQAEQFKFFKKKNIHHYNTSSNKKSNLLSDDAQWMNKESVESKTSKGLNKNNKFIEVNDRLSDCMIQTRNPNYVKREKLKSYCSFVDKSCKLNRNLSRCENKRMVHVNSTATHLQHNTQTRKRAGKDNSTIIYDLSYHTPSLYSYNSNFSRENHTRSKSKLQKGQNIKYQPKTQQKTVPKRVYFNSKSSDQTKTSDDNASNDSSIFMATDLKNTFEKSTLNLNSSNETGMDKNGKGYSYTNRKQRSKEGKKVSKNNNLTRAISSDSFSSTENIPEKYDYISSNPSVKLKHHSTNSRRPRKIKSFAHVNKSNAPLKKPNNKSLHRRRKRENKINNQKFNNIGVYPSKSRSYKKHSARSNKSNVGNFLKRVRNNLSKIRIFSSKRPKNVSESESSKSIFKNPNSWKIPRRGYKIIPKRQGRKYEYANSRYPPRNRVRPHTNGHDVDSTDSSSSSSSSSISQLIYSDNSSSSLSDERSSVSCDYPYLFERVLSSYDDECFSDGDTVPHNVLGPPDLLNSSQQCGVCPRERCPEAPDPPPDENCDDFTDEYEFIFEKVEPKIKRRIPKKVVRRKPLKESISTLSPEPSPSSESVSSSLPENIIVSQPRKYFTRNRLRNVTMVKQKISPPKDVIRGSKHKRHQKYLGVRSRNFQESPEEVVRRSKRKRRRKYIRVGSQKFQKSPEKVVDYEKYIPQPTEKNTFSRGTSTENVQPVEEKFTFHPPVKDAYSRGTSIEIPPLYAKKTSTSDLIRLIQEIGTNTERVITRETGIDPILFKQKTPPIVTEVKSKYTNTNKTNVRSTGTDAQLEKTKPSVVNKANDPLFYLDQKDKTTNTAPEKKKHVSNVGTDPRPTEKLQQATKAMDPLYYLGQQVKSTNTKPVITIDEQTETHKIPAKVSVGTKTTPLRVTDQNTSYDKVKTFTRGNNPIKMKFSDKGVQFDTIQHKQEVKTAFTETYTQRRTGKTTQTSFIETPKNKPLTFQAQTQTDKIMKVNKLKTIKPPHAILKQRKPSIISEELVVVEAEEPTSASPSELSMHLVFEKCQEEIYKRRTSDCKPRCSAYCNRGPRRIVVCDNIRSKKMILNSSSDCNASTITQGVKSPHSDLELSFTRSQDPLLKNFTSYHDLQAVSEMQNFNRTRKPTLGEECGMIGLNTINKQNHTPKNNLKTETDEKSFIKAGIFDSSSTTLTSCDWKHIAEKVKLKN